jgi:hypothetical protein
MNYDKSKLGALVLLLLEKTVQDVVQWKAAEKSNVFQTSFANASIRIVSQGSKFIIEIYNEEGALIASSSDEDLKGLLTAPFSTMQELFVAAQRSAGGIDRTLDSLISELRASGQ